MLQSLIICTRYLLHHSERNHPDARRDTGRQSAYHGIQMELSELVEPAAKTIITRFQQMHMKVDHSQPEMPILGDDEFGVCHVIFILFDGMLCCHTSLNDYNLQLCYKYMKKLQINSM